MPFKGLGELSTYLLPSYTCGAVFLPSMVRVHQCACSMRAVQQQCGRCSGASQLAALCCVPPALPTGLLPALA
jgi:hypothetical protein